MYRLYNQRKIEFANIIEAFTSVLNTFMLRWEVGAKYNIVFHRRWLVGLLSIYIYINKIVDFPLLSDMQVGMHM